MDIASVPDLGTLVERLRGRAAQTSARYIVGLVGEPGSGKSTVAELVAQHLGSDVCVTVPMDGFHLAGSVIAGTPLEDRKGAIDTFDADGYVALLERLRARDEEVVYAPSYRRGLEEPIAASIPIPREIPVVLTEGNYLLADLDPWTKVRKYVDEVWFVEVPRDVRLERLIDRHVAFGKARDEAIAWALGPDEDNARLIASTRHRADQVIEWI
ncbi:nucleoside/nucleotide kinase family protein [Isoptericola sp. b441]|uniref:Nucleoside/nucleotide kinase family protein n=1 Tax=Actinotalea lenta TaxID=3064654 RepID=A0ABT9D6K9_9CELL|nr:MULTISPECIES: nucleoside/nucleotide kinase family protein [unclassified Isoptericola]MDO8106150.1 nucleoside/nucleotide kinase family protein [Isoptericola sp. b441]MDO8122131.1 nucleoside/nucleotide kinase family protein [Isoptericola sp. b490]